MASFVLQCNCVNGCNYGYPRAAKGSPYTGNFYCNRRGDVGIAPLLVRVLTGGETPPLHHRPRNFSCVRKQNKSFAESKRVHERSVICVRQLGGGRTVCAPTHDTCFVTASESRLPAPQRLNELASGSVSVVARMRDRMLSEREGMSATAIAYEK